MRSKIEALLDQELRTSKPRTAGLTIMIDKGQMGPNTIADFAAQAAEYCDYAKIAWGSSLITQNLEEKLHAYQKANITPMFGGTLFEYAYLRNKLPQLLDLVKDLKVHIEVSDGVIEMPRADKLKWIEQFARHVEVFSEVGGKIVRQSHNWKEVIQEEFAAGSKLVVVEGREIGPVGQGVRSEFVETVLAATDPHKLVFEAFERPQQVWLIKRIGPNVNLGNIPPTDLLTVESFRRGLKEHTLLHIWESQRNAASQSTTDRTAAAPNLALVR
jgi:phosphosulfolactate synthase